MSRLLSSSSVSEMLPTKAASLDQVSENLQASLTSSNPPLLPPPSPTIPSPPPSSPSSAPSSPTTFAPAAVSKSSSSSSKSSSLCLCSFFPWCSPHDGGDVQSVGRRQAARRSPCEYDSPNQSGTASLGEEAIERNSLEDSATTPNVSDRQSPPERPSNDLDYENEPGDEPSPKTSREKPEEPSTTDDKTEAPATEKAESPRKPSSQEISDASGPAVERSREEPEPSKQSSERDEKTSFPSHETSGSTKPSPGDLSDKYCDTSGSPRGTSLSRHQLRTGTRQTAVTSAVRDSSHETSHPLPTSEVVATSPQPSSEETWEKELLEANEATEKAVSEAEELKTGGDGELPDLITKKEGRPLPRDVAKADLLGLVEDIEGLAKALADNEDDDQKEEGKGTTRRKNVEDENQSD